jgi:hypothetical protein
MSRLKGSEKRERYGRWCSVETKEKGKITDYSAAMKPLKIKEPSKTFSKNLTG